MVNQISNLPTEKFFGTEFNYERWTANTTITLCKVRWNSDYRDCVRFENQTKLNEYLNTTEGPSITLTRASPAKFGKPISLDIDFSVANQYNYIRVHNPAQPNDGSVPQYYYYFITEVAYGATNTTHLLLQLDVFQTFIYSMKFGQAFVERSHLGIANASQNNDYGRDYLTVPEGMDIGSDYAIIKNYKHTVASANTGESSGSVPSNPNYDIMVVTNTSFTADPGTPEVVGADGKVTPAKPKMNMAEGSDVQNLPNGCDIYIMPTVSRWREVLKHFEKMPWVTQGIVSIAAIPRVARYGMRVQVVSPHGKSNLTFSRALGGNLKRISSRDNGWRDDIVANHLPLRFQHLRKFMTSPYCIVEMTSYAGMPIVLKPEMWDSRDAEVVEVPLLAPPNMRLSFFPMRYNAGKNSVRESDANGIMNDGGEYLDMVTGITNFPTFSTLNNSYASYMANNANSIAYNHSSADWSQQKALTGAQLAQDNTYAGINTSNQLTDIGVSTSQQQTALKNQTMASTAMLDAAAGVAGGVGGGLGGIGSGVANAAMTGIRTGINIDANNQSFGISAGAARASNHASTSLTGQVADSNKGYADFATRGDYAQAIAGINARVQDAKMVQPTTNGQMGGDAFLLANYKWGYDLKVKMIYGSSMVTLGEYWLRFGYNVSRFSELPADLHCMSRFTYYKLQELYIVDANCPETFKQTIRGIFEKGVTIWKNPNDIGTLDMTAKDEKDRNYALPGITL